MFDGIDDNDEIPATGVRGGAYEYCLQPCQVNRATEFLRNRHRPFWWPLAVVHAGRTAVLDKFGVAVRHKTLLWFVNGGQRARKNQVDTLVVSEHDKRHHRWQQGLREAVYYISKLSPPGGLVLDPYAGSGTTCVAALECGRRYIAFEVDAVTARRARARITACRAPAR